MRGRSPTIREVAAAIGARSTDTVMSHLKALKRKGFLMRERQIALADRRPNVVVVVIPVNRGQDLASDTTGDPDVDSPGD
jgi:SOS-response transcriptional repressor LexA